MADSARPHQHGKQHIPVQITRSYQITLSPEGDRDMTVRIFLLFNTRAKNPGVTYSGDPGSPHPYHHTPLSSLAKYACICNAASSAYSAVWTEQFLTRLRDLALAPKLWTLGSSAILRSFTDTCRWRCAQSNSPSYTVALRNCSSRSCCVNEHSATAITAPSS